MPPSITLTDLAPSDKPSGAKRIVRILMHIWHLLTALLLLVIFIISIIFGGFSDLCTIYILPFAVYDILYTLFRLFDKEGKRFLLSSQKFGIFAHLRFRAFLYQAAAAIPLAQFGHSSPILTILALIVLVFGIIMFVLGCFAKEFGFLDWVQEEEKEEAIQLLASDDEDEDAVDILVKNTQASASSRQTLPI